MTPSPPPATIHATCVAIGSCGVLLLGSSGTGKSDLALRLIDRGAVLVSDDRCTTDSTGGRLRVTPPDSIAGKIEIRGVGILDVPHRAAIDVVLAVRLTHRYERLPEPAMTEMVAGCALPVVLLNAFETSAPIKVEAALAALGLRTDR